MFPREIVYRVMIKSDFKQVILSTNMIISLGVIFVIIEIAQRPQREAKVIPPRLNLVPINRHTAGCIQVYIFRSRAAILTFPDVLVSLGSGRLERLRQCWQGSNIGTYLLGSRSICMIIYVIF